MPKKIVNVKSYTKKDGTNVRKHVREIEGKNKSKNRTDKYHETLIELEMISKQSGEDEDEYINTLQDECDVIITDEIAPSFRANQTALYVREPYTKELFDKMINEWSLHAPSHFTEEYIAIVEGAENDKNKKYIVYPQSVEKSEIWDNITDDLNARGVKGNDLTEEEWEKIVYTKSYKEAEKQVAKELIARHLTKRYKLEI